MIKKSNSLTASEYLRETVASSGGGVPNTIFSFDVVNIWQFI
jgi:hypothetical protein